MMRALAMTAVAACAAALAAGCGSSGEPGRASGGSGPRPSCPAGPVRVDRRIELARGIGPLARSNGEIWVANPRGRTVTRVGARTGQVKRFGVPTSPTDVAVGFGAVWTVDRTSGRVLRFDPARLAVREMSHLGVPAAIEMTSSGPWVLSLDDGSLYGFNGKGDAIAFDLAVPVLGAGAMTALGDELWVLGYEDQFLVPVNFKLRRIVRDATRLGLRSVAAMTAGAGFVWLADTAERRMLRFEPQSRSVVTAALPRSIRPVAMAVGACGWTIDTAGRLARFEPATGRFAGRPVRVASSGGDMVADSTGVWVTDPAAGRLLHVSVRTS